MRALDVCRSASRGTGWATSSIDFTRSALALRRPLSNDRLPARPRRMTDVPRKKVSLVMLRLVLMMCLLGVAAIGVRVASPPSSGLDVPDRALHDPRTRGSGDIYPNGVVVDVKQYGAVGDGVRDDTAAIQAAISDNVGDQMAR